MTENFEPKMANKLLFTLDASHFGNLISKIHTFEDELEFIQGLEKSTGKKSGDLS